MLDSKHAQTLGESILALGRQGHASIVMMLTSTIEYDLERCLLLAFRPLNKELKNRLFGAYGPVGTFAAKIDIAYALGITTEAIHIELNKMRRIRNAFAHSKRGLSLDTEPVKTMFYSLVRPAGISGTYLEQFVKCGVVIDDHLEAYLVSKGEIEDLRAVTAPTENADAVKEEEYPAEPETKPIG
jgi:hypothetical protein